MSKQRPDADKLANELMGASAFFRPAPKPEQPEPPTPPISSPLADAQPDPAPAAPTDVTTSRRHDTTTSPQNPGSDGFDLNRPTASRDSLRLSVDETKALEALRSALKWDYDLTVSKNDICRAALHALLEEFAAKGEKSDALKRLKRKQTSR